MNDSYSGAVSLYSEETQISLKCPTFPVLITKARTDAQTDVQDVPVDGDQLIRRLAVLLIYQCMSVTHWIATTDN